MDAITSTSFTTPESRHSVFLTTDIRHARQFLSKTMQPFSAPRIPASARCDCAFQNYAALRERVALSYIRMGMDIEIEPGPLDDFYLVQIPTQGSAEIGYGDLQFRIDPENWAIISPVQKMTMDWSKDCELLEVKIKRSALEASLAKLSGVKADSPIEFTPRFQDDRGRSGNLYQLLVYLCGQIEQISSRANLSETYSQLESVILSMILESQEHSYSAALRRQLGSLGNLPPRYINRAIQFIRSNADRSLRLDDIARAACASVRSLNAGFRKYEQTTPMEYLKNTRLDYVRAALQTSASPRDMTVTDAAIRWGFSHFGRFSAEYKRRFDEHPSDTLRSSREVLES
jgi:AraC-like DNA-binding protein